MASIIKVDTIQHSDGSAPTMAELGLDVSGSILQVKSSTFTGVQSNATDWVYSKINDLDVVLTPKSTNSTFLLSAQISVGKTYFATGFRFYRDGSNITAAMGDASGSRHSNAFGTTIYNFNDGSVQYALDAAAMNYMDTTNASDTTTPITFSIYFSSYSSTQTSTINYQHVNADASPYMRTISTFTVYEIAG
jgi:hypothetical protein